MAAGGFGAKVPDSHVAVDPPGGDMGGIDLTDFAGIPAGIARLAGRGASAGVFSTPVAGITAIGRSTVPIAPPDLSATFATVAVG